MTSEVVSILELVGSNYLSWKIKMIDVLRSNNIWILVKNNKMKPTDEKIQQYGKIDVMKKKDSLETLFQIVYKHILRLRIVPLMYGNPRFFI